MDDADDSIAKINPDEKHTIDAEEVKVQALADQQQFSDNSSRGHKKKRTSSDANIRARLHAKTANKVLSFNANEPSAVTPADKDWDFCKHLCNMIKEIPDGCMKDDLQLEIQQMVNRAKWKCRNGTINLQEI